jgi:tRNA G18 (ribose-2'-O)-methylase SpoU
VDWWYVQHTLDAVNDLKNKGYKVYAVEQVQGSISLEKFSGMNNAPLALVFGNEVEGVATEVIAACNGCIEIPQEGMKHSFNISVAAGIVLWEMVRTKQSTI